MQPHRAFFGDDDQSFALTGIQITALEDASGVGIGGFCQRMMRGDFHHADLTNTIRLGLIGGGMTPENAHKLVTTYVPMTPILTLHILALDILNAVYLPPAAEEDAG